MKKVFFTLLGVTAALFFLNTTQCFAQQSDTLVVSALPFGNLNTVIAGDTTATGERNPNRVYVLQQNGPIDTTYFLTSGPNVTYNLTIVGKPNPVTGKLPVIAPFVDASGSAPGNLFQLTSGDVHFINIYFNGWRPDSVQTTTRVTWIVGDSIRLHFDHCVIDGFQANCVNARSNNLQYIVNDCEFRDLSVNGAGAFWVNGGRDIDSVIFVNNTFYGIAGAAFGDGGWIGYLRFDHNTCFVLQGTPLPIGRLWNAEIQNNIFYAVEMGGSNPSSITKSIASSGNYGNGVIRFDSLQSLTSPPYNLTESQRNVVIKNNAYCLPQKFLDYYASWDSLVAPTWIDMGARTQEIINDHTSWPGIVVADNDSVNPGFLASVEGPTVDTAISFNNQGRLGIPVGSKRYVPFADPSPFDPQQSAQSGWASGTGYPTPENLRYSNTDLYHASTDGLPLGDLNWFPDIEPTGIQEITNTAPTKFELSQNYPNPFNPTTNIKYNLSESGFVSLKVFNILGQEVTALVNGFQKAGSYKVDFNASQLASGVYMYRLETNGFSQTKKMLLMK